MNKRRIRSDDNDADIDAQTIQQGLERGKKLDTWVGSEDGLLARLWQVGGTAAIPAKYILSILANDILSEKEDGGHRSERPDVIERKNEVTNRLIEIIKQLLTNGNEDAAKALLKTEIARITRCRENER